MPSAERPRLPLRRPDPQVGQADFRKNPRRPGAFSTRDKSAVRGSTFPARCIDVGDELFRQTLAQVRGQLRKVEMPVLMIGVSGTATSMRSWSSRIRPGYRRYASSVWWTLPELHLKAAYRELRKGPRARFAALEDHLGAQGGVSWLELSAIALTSLTRRARGRKGFSPAVLPGLAEPQPFIHFSPSNLAAHGAHTRLVVALASGGPHRRDLLDAP